VSDIFASAIHFL